VEDQRELGQALQEGPGHVRQGVMGRWFLIGGVGTSERQLRGR